VRARMAQQDADLRARQAAAAGQQPATAPAPSGNIVTSGQGALQRGYDATRKAIEQQTQFGPADLQSAPAGPPMNHLPSDVGHPENGYVPVDRPLAPNTVGGGVLGRVMPGLRMAQIGANALAANLGGRLAQARANTPGFDEAMEYPRPGPAQGGVFNRRLCRAKRSHRRKFQGYAMEANSRQVVGGESREKVAGTRSPRNTSRVSS
jgi:hypothetical protein